MQGKMMRTFESSESMNLLCDGRQLIESLKIRQIERKRNEMSNCVMDNENRFLDSTWKCRPVSPSVHKQLVHGFEKQTVGYPVVG